MSKKIKRMHKQLKYITFYHTSILLWPFVFACSSSPNKMLNKPHLTSSVIKSSAKKVISNSVQKNKNEAHLSRVQLIHRLPKERQQFKKFHMTPTQKLMLKRTHRSEIITNAPSFSLKIGILLPLSGLHQHWGKLIKKSVEQVTKGKQINVIFADSQSDAAVSIKKIDEWFSSDQQIDALIGPLSPYIAATVAQRILWYEKPWFPLGSLPNIFKNSFTISWRIEAEDEAKALSSVLCKSELQRFALLFDDHPRAHLCARLLKRNLRYCQKTIIKQVVIQKDNQGEVTTKMIHQALLTLSGRHLNSTPDQHWQTIHTKPIFPEQQASPQINFEGLILLPRGRLLTQVLNLLPQWDLEVKPSSLRQQRMIEDKYDYLPPPWLTLFIGLGGASLIEKTRYFSFLEQAVLLTRARLATRGIQYLKKYPQASTLELEFLDLFEWLSQATKYSLRHQKSLIEALRQVSAVQGSWGQRKYYQGRLSTPSLQVWTIHQNKLKELNTYLTDER